MHDDVNSANARGKGGGLSFSGLGREVQGVELVCVQRHNEEKLNDAFCTAAGVFLVFSVNMSGHFQGYARMASPVSRQQVQRECLTCLQDAAWLSSGTSKRGSTCQLIPSCMF